VDSITPGDYTVGPATGAGEAVEVTAVNGPNKEVTLKDALTAAHAASQTLYLSLAAFRPTPRL